jgi:RNA-binding protein Musashi
MTKAALDSDIYAGTYFLLLGLLQCSMPSDIYGDEETDFTEEVLEKSEQGAISGETEADDPQAIEVYESTGTSNQDTYRSLPAKPTGPSGTQLSYSAQIAQQFSVYQQTPSQERQQQQNPRSGQGKPLSAPSEYKAVPGTSTDTVFGKKPSEMHDSG